jgi:hypothetical protein
MSAPFIHNTSEIPKLERILAFAPGGRCGIMTVDGATVLCYGIGVRSVRRDGYGRFPAFVLVDVAGWYP